MTAKTLHARSMLCHASQVCSVSWSIVRGKGTEISIPVTTLTLTRYTYTNDNAIEPVPTHRSRFSTVELTESFAEDPKIIEARNEIVDVCVGSIFRAAHQCIV